MAILTTTGTVTEAQAVAVVLAVGKAEVAGGDVVVVAASTPMRRDPLVLSPICFRTKFSAARSAAVSRMPKNSTRR